ncbi:hypothetical protein ETH_00029945 [Eimeria tenella]|uniref:Uncharacterized protein n=1 Tax=Eimeria tenella TaxID=5802 RepID=U6L0G7_EIMTE|nr:hypothetical protein ETH_00029945 [Eimeria tenella]CDJ43902.1 hypothetical protein ETH_00029945 [Eimeria tenella]|eukprot:XP_013234651.1 hypothetical protein ETH_00029945 [Eimeria tenella]
MADSAKTNCLLSPVESLRACVLLQEALKQLAFIGRLSRRQKAAKPDGLAASRGDEIVRLIAEQQQQQDRCAQQQQQQQQQQQRPRQGGKAAGRGATHATPEELLPQHFSEAPAARRAAAAG